MIIIAESGATKTDWRSVASDGSVHSLRTPGMNLASGDAAYIENALREAVPGLNPVGETVRRIHFYAAGLISSDEKVPAGAAALDTVFRKAFPGAAIEYASDLLDAARAVCGRRPGVAVILGTGSNTCEYDGEKIVKNVRSGGFILGDEGGAASLGRQFMSDYLKGLVPGRLAEEFSASFKVDYLTVVQNVYRGPAPARYLGSFAPFIVEHYDAYEYVRDLVDGNFRALFRRCLSQYDLKGKKVGVVGGFGYALRDILLRVASESGVDISEIMASPIDSLVKYHIEENEYD